MLAVARHPASAVSLSSPCHSRARPARGSERSGHDPRDPASPLPPHRAALRPNSGPIRIRRHPCPSRRESGPRTSRAPGAGPSDGGVVVSRPEEPWGARGTPRHPSRHLPQATLPACHLAGTLREGREALTASAAGPKPRGPRRWRWQWRRRWKRNSAPGLRLPPDLARPRAPRPGASPAARSTRAQLPARLPRE